MTSSNRIIKVKSCISTKKQSCFMTRNTQKRKSYKKKKSHRKSYRKSYRKSIKRSRSKSKSFKKSKRSLKKSKRSKKSLKKSRISKRPRISKRSYNKYKKSKSKRTSKKRTSKKATYNYFKLSKSADLQSQVKNFFKIDQQITYIIKHPSKAKSRNVLKLIGALLIFLLLLCSILKFMNSPIDCNTPITKLKEIVDKLKNNQITPMEALLNVRTALKNLWDKFKNLAPVIVLLNALGINKTKVDEAFNANIDTNLDVTKTEEEEEKKKIYFKDEFEKKYRIDTKMKDVFKFNTSYNELIFKENETLDKTNNVTGVILNKEKVLGGKFEFIELNDDKIKLSNKLMDEYKDEKNCIHYMVVTREMYGDHVVVSKIIDKCTGRIAPGEKYV